jgi:AcrR family transcriptional regulator
VVRTIPEGRFAQLIEVATKTFVARGYRLTQMSDIAEALGVAKGTLYGYVESKEALFDAAVRFADGQGSLPEPGALPLPTPAAGSTVQFIQRRLMEEASQLELVAVLSRPKDTRAPADEFESIVRDLYRRVSRNRHALKLVDRCAVDHPELAAVWFEQGRYGQVALLATYLQKRIAEGRLRAVPNVQLAARMVLETVALWAIHMPWDAAPRAFAADEVENAVVDLLVHAHVPEREPDE